MYGFGLLVILSYLLTYATPLFASYFMFAKPADASFGGAVFYMTIALVAIAFLVKLYGILRKMKISYAKVILSLLFTTVLAMSSKAFFEVVGNNFNAVEVVIQQRCSFIYFCMSLLSKHLYIYLL